MTQALSINLSLYQTGPFLCNEGATYFCHGGVIFYSVHWRSKRPGLQDSFILNGWKPSICTSHEGIVTTILDSILGECAASNTRSWDQADMRQVGTCPVPCLEHLVGERYTWCFHPQPRDCFCFSSRDWSKVKYIHFPENRWDLLCEIW